VITLQGIGSSSGIAVGQALSVGRHELHVPRYRIRAEEIPRELRRFWAARRQAREEIQTLRDNAARKLGSKYAGIFDAHLLILEDRKLGRETVQRVRHRRHNVEWSLAATVNSLLTTLDAVEDPYLRERGGDIVDVHERLQRILAGATNRHAGRLDLTEDTVILAHSLSPSDAIWLNQPRIVGIATEKGGPTSHTAILAAALGIPAVLGVDRLLETAVEGEAVVVDSQAGAVLLQAGETAQEEFRALGVDLRRRATRAVLRGPLHTTDGVEVQVAANLEFPEEMAALERVGAQGVGLFRTEFLWLARGGSAPDEDEHLEAYRRLLSIDLQAPVVIRTLDLGGEKLPSGDARREEEPNPVMGLRAVRYCMAHPGIFRAQLRAVFRAAAETNRVWIMVPMISGLEEWRAVRRFVERVRDELAREGVIVPQVPLGCMIEVPSAALVADRLAREADFLSIGSNDLIQYALAVDRGNSRVAYLHDPWHPAVLRLIRMAVDAGRAAGIPVTFCGEMSSDPLGALTLLGLGVTRFSCTPSQIATVRETVAAASARRWAELVEEASSLPTGREIHDRLDAEASRLLPWRPGGARAAAGPPEVPGSGPVPVPS
jgi:phosphotransferase system enzyme I (PtsI)